MSAMSDVEGIELLTLSHDRLRAVVAGVPRSAWSAPTPCGEWTVAQVLNHARLDQQAYGAAVTGTGWPEGDAFHPQDALEADVTAALDKVLVGVADVYAGLSPDAEEVATPLGPLPFRVAAAAAAMDAGVHAWDIAVATGQASPSTTPWPAASGSRRTGWPTTCATRSACSPPRARSRRRPAGPRRCSPSWAGTRTGRLPAPDASGTAPAPSGRFLGAVPRAPSGARPVRRDQPCSFARKADRLPTVLAICCSVVRVSSKRLPDSRDFFPRT